MITLFSNSEVRICNPLTIHRLVLISQLFHLNIKRIICPKNLIDYRYDQLRHLLEHCPKYIIKRCIICHEAFPFLSLYFVILRTSGNFLVWYYSFTFLIKHSSSANKVALQSLLLKIFCRLEVFTCLSLYCFHSSIYICTIPEILSEHLLYYPTAQGII